MSLLSGAKEYGGSNPINICPPSLLQHLQSRAVSLPWTLKESKMDNATRVVQDIFNLMNHIAISDEKAFRKLIFEASEKIFKTLQLNESLMVSYEQRHIDVTALMEAHDIVRVANKRIFEEITEHHEALVAEGYSNAVSEEANLKKYKHAAHEMGKKEWVVMGNAWMETTAYNFFYGTGAQRAFLKIQKHRSLHRDGAPLSAEEHQRLKDLTSRMLFDEQRAISQQLEGPSGAGSSSVAKPRLLDVGSCHNPFKSSKHAHLFDVTGIDLCPAVDSVLTCDFLAIQVGEPGSGIVTHPQNPQVLLALPAHSFEVVTMSLVLNYLPSHEQREQMVATARQLLIPPSYDHSADPDPDPAQVSSTPHRSGLLLIVEKISIFDWKANKEDEAIARARAKGIKVKTKPVGGRRRGVDPEPGPSRYEWTSCICNMGFELVTYQTNVYAGHHVHLFAFQVADVPAAREGEGGAGVDEWEGSRGRRPRLRIKADR